MEAPLSRVEDSSLVPQESLVAPQRHHENAAATHNSAPKSPLSIRSHGEPSPVNRAALTYIGDDGETPDSLGQLLQPVDPSSSLAFDGYLIPGTASRRTPAEDLEFLRVKGAFSIPPKDICDQAVLAFFRNAHPLLPVIDAKSFLDQYLKHGCQGISLILLWSILHVAASVSRIHPYPYRVTNLKDSFCPWKVSKGLVIKLRRH